MQAPESLSYTLQAHYGATRLIAFGHEATSYPDEDWFNQPATKGQMRYLKCCRDSSMITGGAFRLLCRAILEAYGFEDKINRGTVEVLIEFMKNARPTNHRAAERVAWQMYQ